MKNHVEHEFEEVRTTFFPRWDRGRLWKVEVAHDLDGAQGKCYPNTKTIKILDGMTGLDLTALLIHEIAHAAVNVWHGGRWRARMLVAAEQAERLGKGKLAQVLRKQVAQYGNPDSEVTPTMVYDEIEDILWQRPGAEFEQVVDFLRRDVGLSREDFVRRYRRARTVFEEAKAEAEERVTVRERMMQ
jgi:hypothetical protein